MKNLLLITIILFCTVSIFAQSKNKKPNPSTGNKENNTEVIISQPVYGNDDFFLCINQNDTVIVDEQISFTNDEYGERKQKKCEGLINKYGGKGATAFHFNSFKDEFKDLTKMTIGEKWLISTSDGVTETKITGYKIDMPVVGFEFYPVAEKPVSAVFLQNDYDKNIYVISKNPAITPVRYISITDAGVESAIKKSLSKFQKTFKPDIKDGDFISRDPEIKIIQGNFTGSSNTEYAVSFVQAVSYEGYASGIVIMDGSGNIIKEMFALTPSDFNYNRIVGVLDINGDGIDEIIIENGYYEGNGYELWKYSSPSFLKIAGGFYWGV